MWAVSTPTTKEGGPSPATSKSCIGASTPSSKWLLDNLCCSSLTENQMIPQILQLRLRAVDADYSKLVGFGGRQTKKTKAATSVFIALELVGYLREFKMPPRHGRS